MLPVTRRFFFETQEVRITDRNGEPWWVLVDVCGVLEIGNSSDVARRLDEDEKGVDTIDTLGGPQGLVIINEPGLYKLIATSRKPEAKRFDRWVRHEVLPTIRRTGVYGVPAAAEKSEMAQLTEMFVSGMKEAIAPLGLRLSEFDQRFAGQDEALERVETRVTCLAEDVTFIKKQIVGRRRCLNLETKAEHVDAIRVMGGTCPCCGIAEIIENTRKSKFSDYDHFYQNSYPNADHTWLICKPCHSDLTYGRRPRDEVEPMFKSYQARRRRLPGRQALLL
jgi:prophage antirepressor-like protein